MPICPVCSDIIPTERGLKAHTTRKHGASATSVPFTEPIDIDIGVDDDEPLIDDPLPPPRLPKKPVRKRTANVQPDSAQIADMLLFMLDGIIAMSMGEAAKIDPLEHEYIDPALKRLIDRHMPSQLSDRAASYADVLFLGFGMTLWAIRVYRLQQAARPQMPPVPDRFSQEGTLSYEGPPQEAYYGPLNNTTEASVLRSVQTPPNGTTGTPPVGVTPPIWDDSTGMMGG